MALARSCAARSPNVRCVSTSTSTSAGAAREERANGPVLLLRQPDELLGVGFGCAVSAYLSRDGGFCGDGCCVRFVASAGKQANCRQLRLHLRRLTRKGGHVIAQQRLASGDTRPDRRLANVHA